MSSIISSTMYHCIRVLINPYSEGRLIKKRVEDTAENPVEDIVKDTVKNIAEDLAEPIIFSIVSLVSAIILIQRWSIALSRDRGCEV